MKKIAFISMLIAAIFNGCLITSFHPFYKPSDLVSNELLVGEWINQNSLLTFSKLDQGYLLNYKDCKDPYNAPNDYSTCTMADFTVYLMKLGNHYYIDFYPRAYMSTDNLFLNLHIKPTHSLAKVTVEKDRLEFRMLNYNWVSSFLEKNHKKLSHVKLDDIITLTAGTDELQAYILKYENEPSFFDEPVTLKRK